MTGREVELTAVALLVHGCVHRNGVAREVGERAGQHVFDELLRLALGEIGEFATKRNALPGARAGVAELEALAAAMGQVDVGGRRIDGRAGGRDRIQ